MTGGAYPFPVSKTVTPDGVRYRYRTPDGVVTTSKVLDAEGFEAVSAIAAAGRRALLEIISQQCDLERD